tara:strand:+ start:94 stop:300 length:207 start_codon:yes stop_codon:yes gene_type:complete
VFQLKSIGKQAGNVLKDIRFYIILTITVTSVVRKSINLQQFFINLGKNIRLALARLATWPSTQGPEKT